VRLQATGYPQQPWPTSRPAAAAAAELNTAAQVPQRIRSPAFQPEPVTSTTSPELLPGKLIDLVLEVREVFEGPRMM